PGQKLTTAIDVVAHGDNEFVDRVEAFLTPDPLGEVHTHPNSVQVQVVAVQGVGLDRALSTVERGVGTHRDRSGPPRLLPPPGPARGNPHSSALRTGPGRRGPGRTPRPCAPHRRTWGWYPPRSQRATTTPPPVRAPHGGATRRTHRPRARPCGAQGPCSRSESPTVHGPAPPRARSHPRPSVDGRGGRPPGRPHPLRADCAHGWR